MAEERIVDLPEPISDEALDGAAGGSVVNLALAQANELVQILSNIQKTRSEITNQTVRNVRG